MKDFRTEKLAGILQHSKRDWVKTGGSLVCKVLGDVRAKACIASSWCSNQLDCIDVTLVRPSLGVIDKERFLFKDYFADKRCSQNAPLWSTFLDESGKWNFEQYTWCLPTKQDFKSIAEAIDLYLDMMI